MKARGIRRRRGSYIIEAAFIYPAIVLISTMLILLMLFLFSSIQDLSQTDAGVRESSCGSVGNGMVWKRYRKQIYNTRPEK